MPQKRRAFVKQAALPALDNQVLGHGNNKYRTHKSWGDQDDENIYVCQWNADQTYSIKLQRI